MVKYDAKWLLMLEWSRASLHSGTQRGLNEKGICVFNLGLLQLLQLCGLACVQTEALPSDSRRNRQASLL